MPMMRPHADVHGHRASDADDRQAPAAGSSDPCAAACAAGACGAGAAPRRSGRAGPASRATPSDGSRISAPSASATSERDQHRAARRRLLDREARQELRTLREAPARDDRGHGRRRRSRAQARSAAPGTKAIVGRAGERRERSPRPSAGPLVSPSQIRPASSCTTTRPARRRARRRTAMASARVRNASLELGLARRARRRRRGRRRPGRPPWRRRARRARSRSG